MIVTHKIIKTRDQIINLNYQIIKVKIRIDHKIWIRWSISI
jgi:hypothetical protein